MARPLQGFSAWAYLSINGRVRTLIYTYYNYDNGSGVSREIPAYCVNPNTTGVPQTVSAGESIEYLADERASDPKVVGIVANGYPTRSLQELGLENKYQGYYATKMALWCYLLSNWDISNLKVNPNLTGTELQRAQNMLAAAKDIYARGTAWTEIPSVQVTCTPDRETAYEVTINGQQYKQQVFTFWSKTWVNEYSVDVSFTVPDEVPEGTRIVNMDNQDITTITTEATGDGYAGKFKVLYNQTDSRWGNEMYGKSGTIGTSGCGPTALAIVVASLTDHQVTPLDVANWSVETGHRCEGNGSYHSLMPDGGAHYGLTVTGIGNDPEKLVEALKEGKLVIAIMSKGHFTSSGHFIVLRGVTEDGKILVADPASVKRSNQEWELGIIVNEASRKAGSGGPFWVFST